jgi:hypothetical protein
MKVAVVNSSDLGLTCWSPKRFTEGCNDCGNVGRCKLEGGYEGRVKRQRKTMEKRVAEAEMARKRLEISELELKDKFRNKV